MSDFDESTLPPGPSESSWHQLWRYYRDPYSFFSQCLHDFGDAFTMRYPGNPPLVVVSHPAAVKEFFTASPEDLRAGEANEILRSVVGDRSLFVLDGAPHQHHRREANRAVQGHAWTEHFENAASIGARRLSSSGRIAIQPHVDAVALEAILAAMFSGSPESVRTDLRLSLQAFGHHAVGSAATLAAMVVPPRMARSVAARLPASRLLRAQRALRRQVIEELVRRRAMSDAPDDVVSALQRGSDEAGNELSTDEVYDQVVTLILAGHETSATTLAWATYFLAQRPELQSELYGELSTASAQDCALLDSVVKETLRKVPVVPVIPRRAARAIELGGFLLSRGLTVAVSPYLTQNREDVWQRPQQFEPKRFIGAKNDPYAFFPFGGGGRRCLGLTFAMSLMKSVLAEMVRRFEWQMAEPEVSSHERRGVLVGPPRQFSIVVSGR